LGAFIGMRRIKTNFLTMQIAAPWKGLTTNTIIIVYFEIYGSSHADYIYYTSGKNGRTPSPVCIPPELVLGNINW